MITSAPVPASASGNRAGRYLAEPQWSADRDQVMSKIIAGLVLWSAWVAAAQAQTSPTFRLSERLEESHFLRSPGRFAGLTSAASLTSRAAAGERSRQPEGRVQLHSSSHLFLGPSSQARRQLNVPDERLAPRSQAGRSRSPAAHGRKLDGWREPPSLVGDPKTTP